MAKPKLGKHLICMGRGSELVAGKQGSENFFLCTIEKLVMHVKPRVPIHRVQKSGSV